MPQFQFTARDARGHIVKGQRKALSAEDLAGQLQNDALIPIEINKTTQSVKHHKKTHWTKQNILQKKVSQQTLQMFCRQLYTVLKSGIPLATAIARLAETTHDKLFTQTLQNVLANLNSGQSLHASFARFPAVFSDFFVNMVKLGESSGKLDDIFLYLSDYLELEIDTRKKVKTAMRYPISVIAITFISIIVVSTLVIPAFADMFKSFHAELPLPTRILLATSHFITHYWYVVLGIMGGLLFLLSRYIKTPTGKIQWAKLQLKIPVIGNLVHRIILARFARLYALVLEAGLTAVDGIEMVAASIGNSYVHQRIKLIAELVGRGHSIASSIEQTQLFPPLVLQMITLGEETGRIEELLNDVADFYRRDVEYDLLRLTDLLQPVLMIIVAVMVLILALGVYLPMWELAGKAMR